MKKAKGADSFLFSAVSVALVLVVSAFVIAWFYFRQSNRPLPPPVSYSTFGPIVVRATQFSIKAKVSVQTSNENLPWVRNNWSQLDVALKIALAGLDPQRVRGPDGLAYVQEKLRGTTNAELHTQNIQQVLLSDFIIQSNE